MITVRLSEYGVTGLSRLSLSTPFVVSVSWLADKCFGGSFGFGSGAAMIKGPDRGLDTLCSRCQ
jgi:hypothetical protein